MSFDDPLVYFFQAFWRVFVCQMLLYYIIRTFTGTALMMFDKLGR